MKKRREDWETNRDMGRRPKLGKTYCLGCDACLVGSWEKCGNCGRHNKEKYRYKK